MLYGVCCLLCVLVCVYVLMCCCCDFVNDVVWYVVCDVLGLCVWCFALFVCASCVVDCAMLSWLFLLCVVWLCVLLRKYIVLVWFVCDVL